VAAGGLARGQKRRSGGADVQRRRKGARVVCRGGRPFRIWCAAERMLNSERAELEERESREKCDALRELTSTTGMESKKGSGTPSVLALEETGSWTSVSSSVVCQSSSATVVATVPEVAACSVVASVAPPPDETSVVEA
jgi:hypothetical protein